MNKINSFLIVLLIGINALFAQTKLDGNFASEGKAITNIGNNGAVGQSIAIQADGKIVVGGYTSNNGMDYDFALVRYNANGWLDLSFGIQGKVITPLGNASDFGKSIALQSDGKILLAGYSSNGENADFAIARYNTNGSLDLSFGKNGIVKTDIANGNDYGKAVAIQTNGKIVLTGESYNGYNYDFATIRYNVDGSLDCTFANKGIAITDLGNNDDAEALSIDFFGNIIIAGYSVNSNKDIALVRYTSTGILDQSFNRSGKTIIDIGNMDNAASAMMLQPNGEILVTGYSNNEDYNALALLRLNRNGKLDYDFGDKGMVTSELDLNAIKGSCLSLQADGKIVVGGYKNNSNDYDFALMRYNDDGSNDNYFSDNIEQITIKKGSNDYCYAMAVQQDGKIVVAGSTSIGSTENFEIARYISSEEISASVR